MSIPISQSIPSPPSPIPVLTHLKSPSSRYTQNNVWLSIGHLVSQSNYIRIFNLHLLPSYFFTSRLSCPLFLLIFRAWCKCSGCVEGETKLFCFSSLFFFNKVLWGTVLEGSPTPTSWGSPLQVEGAYFSYLVKMATEQLQLSYIMCLQCSRCRRWRNMSRWENLFQEVIYLVETSHTRKCHYC